MIRMWVNRMDVIMVVMVMPVFAVVMVVVIVPVGVQTAFARTERIAKRAIRHV